jgi:hypothetical protein
LSPLSSLVDATQNFAIQAGISSSRKSALTSSGIPVTESYNLMIFTY